jgi:hypothetical protein
MVYLGSFSNFAEPDMRSNRIMEWKRLAMLGGD